MYAILALMATVLTSLLPILTKQLLRIARPAVVAWAINAASLPILGVGTLLVTQCRLTGDSHHIANSLTCGWQAPHIDNIFIVALVGSTVLNWAATLLSTRALAAADASLVSPLLTFNPAFTLIVAWIALGETPGWRQTVGVMVILLGAYVLEVNSLRSGLATPLRTLLRRPGAALAILASAIWGSTTVLEKLAIEHVTPHRSVQNGALVAFASTLLLVAFLTPAALVAPRSELAPLRQPQLEEARAERWHAWRNPRSIIGRTLLMAALLAGIAPLFGFSAIALGDVGYVTALFKLSAVLTVVWGWLVLKEVDIHQRLLGALIMVIGGALVVG